MDDTVSVYDTGVRPHVDAYLDRVAKEKRDYGQYWSASSAGYCPRLNILKRLDVPPVPEIASDRARTIRVFESGKIFHEWVQRITKDDKVSLSQEKELISDELMVKGHYDDLVQINGRNILYDYKTAHSAAFNFPKAEVGHYHKMQLGTYAYMLDNKVDELRIMQISKDDLRMREMVLTPTPELAYEVKEYWKAMNEYWDNKILPPCECLKYDGGFMGRRSKKGKVYNDFYYNETPCSEEWIKKNGGLDGWAIL